MYTKQEIILISFREGKSQRAIARDLQISRKTVKKYIQEHESLLQSLENNEAAQVTNLSLKPFYNMTEPRPKIKLTVEVQEIIDEMLSKNKEKLDGGLRKQMMKKKDIHEALLHKGFDIGYATVCNYIRFKENQQTTKEAFIGRWFTKICVLRWQSLWDDMKKSRPLRYLICVLITVLLIVSLIVVVVTRRGICSG